MPRLTHFLVPLCSLRPSFIGGNMTDILIIIAICVGVICLIATIAVGLKVKNSSAGAAEKKLEEITRLLVRAEALQG